MKKSIVLLAAALLLATGCGPPSVASSQAQFCQDLAELDQAVKSVAPLTSSTTVGQVKSGAQQVRTAWNKVKQSAGNLGQAYMTDLEAAENDLDRSLGAVVGTLPDDTPLGQVGAQTAAQLFPKLAALSNARETLSSQALCGG